MKTTFVERAKMNREVYNRANAAVQAEGGTKIIKTFREAYAESKLNRMQRTFRARPSDPIRTTSFTADTQAWVYPLFKPGRPRQKWADEAMRELWNRTRKRMTPSRSGEELDHKDKRKTRILQEFVQNDIHLLTEEE